MIEGLKEGDQDVRLGLSRVKGTELDEDDCLDFRNEC